MTRSHPQWLRARDLVREGAIGDLRAISAVFSYFNDDPTNVRNMAEIGGGALYDIGCYPITMSRFLFDAEPIRVVGVIDRDPEFRTDRRTSVLIDYAGGQVTFTVSTQLVPYQRVQVLGTKGRIDIEIPFNPPPDRPARILLDDGGTLDGSGAQAIAFDPVDQYTIQGDLFSKAVREGGEQVLSLESSVENTRIIDAIFRSAAEDRWIAL